MGLVFVTGPCYCCGSIISFHPNLVPSIQVEGVREPVCSICIDKANPEREKRGLDPITIPEGAYEAADESEINWEE